MGLSLNLETFDNDNCCMRGARWSGVQQRERTTATRALLLLERLQMKVIIN